MKKLSMVVVAGLIALSGCTIVDTDANKESVLVDRPWIFGTGGVRDETFKTGREYTWHSTSYHQINMNPFTVEEVFDDLTTSEGSFVDFNTSLQVRYSNAVERYKIGENWYEAQLQKVYQEIMRREVVKHTLTNLRTNPETQVEVEKEVKKQMLAAISELKLPIVLMNISLGKAKPNKNVQDQIDLTTAQQQRKQTMADMKAAEEARAEAETSRAKADNAYRNAMGLDPKQFIELERIKQFSEACKKAEHCNILNGVDTPVVVK